MLFEFACIRAYIQRPKLLHVVFYIYRLAATIAQQKVQPSGVYNSAYLYTTA